MLRLQPFSTSQTMRYPTPSRGIRIRRLPILLAMTWFTMFATAGQAADDERPRAPSPQAQSVEIPVTGAGTFGGSVAMQAEVFRPAGPGPFPVVIFSHGRAPERLDRAQLKHPIQNWHVQYWLDRGVAVVAAIRVGYGDTGGPDRENSGSTFDTMGRCTSKPNFRGLATVLNDSTLATIQWLRGQPWADSQRIVLEGRSVGGFASVAGAAAHLPGVIGYVNFSGGAGGSPTRSPGHSCDPDQMRDVMAEFGRQAAVPGLWLYAKNDLYFGGDAPLGWYQAFAEGGSPARLVSVEELPGRDGHLLLSYGQRYWRKDLDTFVKSLGL